MTARVAWIGAALLVATACNATESRWVLWGYTIAGGWVPIIEYRTLDECNRFSGWCSRSLTAACPRCGAYRPPTTEALTPEECLEVSKMGPYRESRLKSLILVMSAIITLSGCATSVSFQSADRSTTVDGTLFKPDGAGPFPGVVLLHGCGGIRPHFVQWAGAIRDMGYVALLVDSFRPRGISGICASSPTMASMTTDRVADAYGALRQLKALPFVDGDRVALIGWSHGGWTTLEAMASWRYRSSPDQFRAAIAFYPYCRDALNEPFRAPLLVLIGGSDDWTPAKKCEDMQARLRLVNPDAAQSLRVQVYQGAHHDFDDVAAKNCCGHTLRYNRDAAKDAEDQVRRFLTEHMKGAQREGGR